MLNWLRGLFVRKAAPVDWRLNKTFYIGYGQYFFAKRKRDTFNQYEGRMYLENGNSSHGDWIENPDKLTPANLVEWTPND